jgi:predicted metal-dependent phosphoesterase TrpH
MNQQWSKADLHLHTSYSDGTASVAAVLEHVATRTDLQVIAITDHDTIDGALEARRLAPAYGIEVIVGEEVSTAEGHLLALFIEQRLPPGRPAAETIAAVHAQGGLCFPAHPFGWLVPSLGWHGLRERAAGPHPAWPVDGVESFNASLCMPRNNTQAARLGVELNLACLGGSDSHHLATIGRGYTVFPGQTPADLRAAILRQAVEPGGRFWGWPAYAMLVSLWTACAMDGLAQRALRSFGYVRYRAVPTAPPDDV